MFTFQTLDGLLESIESVAKNNKPMFNTTQNLSFSPLFSQYYINEMEDGSKKIIVNVVGHNPSDIDITIDNDEILIKASKKKDAAGFVRDINLEFSVVSPYDGKLTEASIKDGILTLIVNKSKEEKTKKVKLKL
jgi:HSP20 family molecular chaperone IbpA